MHRNILVTGGCGFIGANLIRTLCARGCTTRVLDDLSVGSPENLEGLPCETLEGDVRNRKTVREATKGMEAVIHLAAHTSVVESIEHPDLDFEVNVGGTLNLLEASVEQGIKKFVFASSNAPLGEQNPPVHENKVPRPLSPYGASKLAAEGYCSAFHGSYGLNTVCLRFSNAYGPYSSHKGSVVAKFIKRLLDGQPLIIYGDGKQTRDFVYVTDLCEAMVLALESELGGATVHIGTGVETSVLELVEGLKALVGCGVKVQFEPARQGEIRRNYSSIKYARKLLGFHPNVDFQTGLRECYRWFQANSSR